MKLITKSLCTLLFLVSSTTILAQATTAEVAAESGAPPDPCIAADRELTPGGAAADDAPGAVSCEEQVPGGLPGDAVEDAFADAEENELKTTGDDVTAQEEFETGEEISEDYPVPLPSDI